MSDSPSAEELRRIRHVLVWLIVVVAANGLYAPDVYGGLNAPGYLVLVVSFFAGVLYFAAQFFGEVAAAPDTGDS